MIVQAAAGLAEKTPQIPKIPITNSPIVQTPPSFTDRERYDKHTGTTLEPDCARTTLPLDQEASSRGASESILVFETPYESEEWREYGSGRVPCFTAPSPHTRSAWQPNGCLIRHLTKWVVESSEVNGEGSRGVGFHKKSRYPLRVAEI